MKNTPADQFQTAPGRTVQPDLSSLVDGPKDAAGPMAKKEHRTHRPVMDHGSRFLSKKQIIVLAQLARDAFAFQRDLGLIDDGQKLNDWRHAEQLAACGQASLKAARQHHYVHLRGHFESLRTGNPSAGTFKDLTTPADDHDCKTNMRLLRDALAGLARAENSERKPMGDEGAIRYILAIAKNQAKGLPPKDLDQIANTWPPQKIETLIYTVNNRARAINKVGSNRNRKKSQRRR